MVLGDDFRIRRILALLVRQWIHVYVSSRRRLWSRLQKTVESPQLQSIVVVDIPCRGAEADSYGHFDHRSPVCL